MMGRVVVITQSSVLDGLMNDLFNPDKWLLVNGFDNYMISVNGEVFSWNRNRLMSKYINSGGFYCIDLSLNGISHNKLIHVLVAQSFIPNERGCKKVIHIDGNKLNNVVSNLEWF